MKARSWLQQSPVEGLGLQACVHYGVTGAEALPNACDTTPAQHSCAGAWQRCKQFVHSFVEGTYSLLQVVS